MVELQGRLDKDPLFLGLTRPTIVLGVTYSWFAVEGLGALLWFINLESQRFYAFPLLLLLHGIGVMLCSHEPRFLDIFKVSIQVNTKCTNKAYHNNTSSYDPL